MLVSNLNVSKIRTHGTPVRYSPFENQPIVAPNHRLLGVLKAGGPKGTEFAVDVSDPITYECAVYSVVVGRGFDHEYSNGFIQSA